MSLNDMKYKFPDVKLSYETIVHNKVCDFKLAFAIPSGKKCFAWFTKHQNKSVCLMTEMDYKNKKMVRYIKQVTTGFSFERETIFYGTFFYHLNHPFFSIEDMLMYKGRPFFFPYRNVVHKINHISTILKTELIQVAYNSSCVVFGLPVIITPSDNFEQCVSTVPYKLNAIKYCNDRGAWLMPIKCPMSLFVVETKMPSVESKMPSVESKIPSVETKIPSVESKIMNNKKAFMIKPDIQNDIYHLYENDVYMGVAGIPDYKTSAMMNSVFRTIKENDDLDRLEESDDESEFESDQVDKFVFLDKTCKMECYFNYRFKKWIPNKIMQ